MGKRLVAGAIGCGLATALCAGTAFGLDGGRPPQGMWIIAHRGTPVYAAESTMASYQRAFDLGADFLEGDLVLSKDNVLLLSHDVELSRVSNIASLPEFAGRASTRDINGITYTGWWVDDFTWQELQALRTVDGQQLLSFDQLLDFALPRGKNLYMEIKESPYFASRNMDITQAMIDTLAARGQTGRDSLVWLQSVNYPDLQKLRAAVGNRLGYITRNVSVDDLQYLPTYRQFADILIVPTTRVRRQLVQQAHAADLSVHIWTLRGSRDAYRKAAAVGADGVITDFPDLGRDVRDNLRPGNVPGGLNVRIENGSAVAGWTPAGPGTWYAVTFDFGDPLEAPTIWTQQAAASMPMADAKTVKVTVSIFDGNRLGDDAVKYAQLTPPNYPSPPVRTRVSGVSVENRPDARTVIRGRFEYFADGKKEWVPLKRSQGWLIGQGDDLPSLRRRLRSDKKGEFTAYVRVRQDILSGYMPERRFKVGVTQRGRFRYSASDWLMSAAEAVPQPAHEVPQRPMPQSEVRFRAR